MYLSYLSIDNYRALQSLRMSLEDSVTVLMGENGCGKSSILNALEAVLGRGLKGAHFNFKLSDFHRQDYDSPQDYFIRVVLGFCDKTSKQQCRSLLYNTKLVDEYGLLNFRLVVLAERDEWGYITTSFHFEDKQRIPINFQEGELDCVSKWVQKVPRINPDVDDPRESVHRITAEDCLNEVRRLCPYMRVRSAALTPPSDQQHDAEQKCCHEAVGELDEASAGIDSKRKVEGVLHQAYGELMEVPERVINEFIKDNDDLINNLLSRLDRQTPCYYDDIEDRLAAPQSAMGNWHRLAGLLRGSGARSLAMLTFTEAMVSARGGAQFDEDCHPIISVEDPEAYLHPLMLNAVWSLIMRLPTQRIVTTNSTDLLSAVSLYYMRRIVRTRQGVATVYQVHPQKMNTSDLRRIAYHLRIRRGTALFMRFWLLVEGETEYWLLPEVARALGYDLWDEGVEFVEFAQCGLAPLASLANCLGISWHLLADGDKAGRHYAQTAWPLASESGLGRVTVLPELDIENCFWENGYDYVFRREAGAGPANVKSEKPRDIIHRAIKHCSKPGLALALGQAMTEPGSPGVPAVLANLIRDAVNTARHMQRSGGAVSNFNPKKLLKRKKKSKKR